MTRSKQPLAADVLTATQWAQDPVRALETSLTDSPCSVLCSPYSEMCCYKLSNHEKAVLEERRVKRSLLKRLEEDCDTSGRLTPFTLTLPWYTRH